MLSLGAEVVVFELYTLLLPLKHKLQLLPGVLTIVDQMPGHMEVSDETDKLQNTGYWASYNRPVYNVRCYFILSLRLR